jgi:hypothetical protein
MAINPLAKLNLYPVIIAKKGAKFPTKGTFFVIAANGAFVRKDLGIFEGLVSMPLKDIPGAVKVGYAVKTNEGTVYVQKETTVSTGWQQNNWWNKDADDDTLQIVDPNTGKLMGDTAETLDQRLLAVEPYINMNLPKLPQEVIYKALLFFRKVYNKHHAEAIVLLAYNEAQKEYKLFCPKQKVSGGHIDYDRDLSERLTTVRENEDSDWLALLEDGYTKVGTIHSHCNFQAFHSGTDTGDEASFNGVHITLGHVVDQEFSVAASLALNDYREEVDVENVALGIQRVGDKKAAQSAYISSGRQNFYQIDIEAAQKQTMKDQFETEIDADWMNKVTPSFQQWQGGTGSQASWGGGVVSGGGYGGGYSSYSPSTTYGDSYDDPSDIPGGVPYSYVNGQWVEDKPTGSTTAEIEKSESEVSFTEAEYAEEKEPVTDIPDYDAWLAEHPEMKQELEGGQG